MNVFPERSYHNPGEHYWVILKTEGHNIVGVGLPFRSERRLLLFLFCYPYLMVPVESIIEGIGFHS